VAEENPRLELASGPFFLPRAETPWKRDGGPRRAGVSSFGFGGTNPHPALEEAPQPPREVSAKPLRKARTELFLLAGERASTVARFARELVAALPLLQREQVALADVAFTLSQRSHGDARLAVSADSFDQLAARLTDAAAALEKRGDLAPDPMPPPPPPPPPHPL